MSRAQHISLIAKNSEAANGKIRGVREGHDGREIEQRFGDVKTYSDKPKTVYSGYASAYK